jgi:rod shape-determining protein MreC
MKISHSPLFEKPSRSFSRLIIYVTVCLALFAVDTRAQYLNQSRAWVKNLLLPLETALISSQEYLSYSLRGLWDGLSMQRKIDSMHQEQLSLSNKVKELAVIKNEINQLRALHQLPARDNDPLMTAEVVARQYDGLSQKVLLSKGRNDGFRLGMAVISEAGLFGQISMLFERYAEVSQINHAGISIPVKVQGTTIHGVVYGLGEDSVEFRNFPQRYQVQVGDRLVTSGLDGLFYADIPVATITSIKPSVDNSGVLVTAEPLVDFSNTRFVATSLTNHQYGEWLDNLHIEQYERQPRKK